ncbi:succinate dehydrogenase subunit 5, mitochondrial [Impatiens glandulifera]|uniref:succinate dehydrogenase subunit 5, mitochondrial n=1 Tax=Impatiens glandulifera TaxID=253017 RepID=UPI001FB08CFA|nr:succinate dehydrogenase subunit 5, mitochondrial [Impatiens glandulifera]
MTIIKFLYRSIYLTSSAVNRSHHQILRPGLRYLHLSPRPLLPKPSPAFGYNGLLNSLPSAGSVRYYSEDMSHMPAVEDPEIVIPYKDLMAASWDELPDTLIHDAKKALSKNTDDKAGQEVLKNVFRAAEAVEEFGGMLVSLRMEIDDSIGLSGEDVKPLPEHLEKALITIYQRYVAYLDSFVPEETYLRKKVETELGTKMIHLKMRCSHIGSEWGKVTVLGTSGLSGSYIEQRA